MPTKIIIAGVQMDPQIGEKVVNLDNCLAKLQEASGAGARLAVFPECALTGYCFNSLDEALAVAEPVPGPSTGTIAAACRRLGAWVVIGLLEKDGECVYNAAALVGPEGVAGKYRKVHLPYLGVDKCLNRGALPFGVFETPVGRIGMQICYDGAFPEPARVMALRGADIIAMPTNWPSGRERMPNFVIHTRALENKVYYVAVNRVGQERGTSFIGRSKIISTEGEALAESGTTGEEIIYAEVDLEKARHKHTVVTPGEFEYNIFKDRRPELYSEISRLP